jgi:hypothetical protein
MLLYFYLLKVSGPFFVLVELSQKLQLLPRTNTFVSNLVITIIIFIYFFIFFSSSSLLSLIFEIFDLMLSDWVLFLAYPNLFGIKGFVVVVVVVLYGNLNMSVTKVLFVTVNLDAAFFLYK